MITTRTGDILEQPDLHAIVHQMNCFHTMGTGIARALRIKWPEVYEADKKTSYGDRMKLGTFSKAVVEGGRLWIYNLYSQIYSDGGEVKTDFLAMEKGLKNINSDLNTPRYYEGGIIRIGIPHGMGCGLAGGDWDRVIGILNEIYDLGPGCNGRTYENYQLIIYKKEWGNG